MAHQRSHRSSTLVGASASASCAPGPQATKEELEAHWKSKVTGSAGEAATRRSSALCIAMSGQSLEDSRMEHWCVWFRNFVKELFHREADLHIRDVNFSTNRLSAKGVQQLLSTLQQLRARVGVLRLWQNDLQNADAVCDFILFCEGSIRELHLSHNKLDAVSVRNVIFTTAAASSSATGSYVYPRHGRNGLVPLWLRLEGNDNCDNRELVSMLKSALQQIGRPYEKAICEVDSKTECCPSFCAECRVAPPAHILYMNLSERARNRNDLPSTAKMPSLLQAALKAAAMVAAAAKVSSEVATHGTAAANVSATAAATFAPAPQASASSAASRAEESKAASTPAPASRSALVAETAKLPPDTMRPPPGLSLPAFSSKGCKECAPKTFILQEDFPALPVSSGKMGRPTKTKQKQKPGPETMSKQSSLESKEVLSLSRVSTSASTGDDEDDGRQPDSTAGRSGISYDKNPNLSSTGEASSWGKLANARETSRTVGAKACRIEVETCQSDTKVCDEKSSGWTSRIAFQGYEAEAPGYLTVAQDDQLLVFEVDLPTKGDANCSWPAYVFASITDTKGFQGWVPVDILALRYVTDTGRKWLFVPSTEQCRWETEEKIMVRTTGGVNSAN